MASQDGPVVSEYSVRVPPLSQSKTYNIFKFAKNLNVDTTQWKSISLEREDNSTVYEDTTSKQPQTGAGSVFGQKAKEIARRKKMGYAIRNYNLDNQPWILTDHDKKDKRYKGLKEGGIGEHSTYWIFIKNPSDNSFVAYPAADWYNFLPIARHKTLDADEAEEQFEKRNRILNQFAVMKTGEKLDEMADVKPSKEKLRAALRITDAEDRRSSGDEKEDGVAEATSTAPKSAAKQTGKAKRQNKRAEKVEKDNDEVASLDSDDGDGEGREVDYMSDTESSEEEEPQARAEAELVGVDEEAGLRMMLSDQEDEEEAVEDEEDKNDDSNMPPIKAKGDDSSSESSDSDDPDKEDIQSALFLQKKAPVEESKNGTAAAATTSSPASTSSSSADANPASDLKRKAIDEADVGAAKKKKTSSSPAPSGITEEEVRRYLQRKPHTTKELVSKFRHRCAGMDKNELVSKLAAILRKLNPEKHNAHGKTYFSLK